MVRLLASTSIGAGEQVVLLHGGLMTGQMAWFAQQPLAERRTLIAVDRAGYGASADLAAGEDIELDALLVASSLGKPAHVVGHSSGAIVAILAAAAAPNRVRSLTILEPPSYSHIDDAWLADLVLVYDRLFDDKATPDIEWLPRFFATFGEPPGADVLAALEPAAKVFRNFVRRPWDIPLPLGEIAAAGVPCLVVSGGYLDGFERLNDAIAQSLSAQRAVVAGAGHAIQYTGGPFNTILEDFLDHVERTLLT